MGITVKYFWLLFLFHFWSSLVLSDQASTQKSVMLKIFQHLHKFKMYQNFPNNYCYYDYVYNYPPKWNASTSPCKWEGVTCSNNSVTQLSLSGIGITNPRVISIACQIETLEVLDLSQNNLVSIPTEFITSCGKLPSLKLVNFSKNCIHNKLPSFTEGSFTNLESLDLSRNDVYGSIGDRIEGLVNLRSLNLSGNNLEGFISLGKIKGLQFISLCCNSLNGLLGGEVPAMAGEIQILDLSHNSISGTIPDVVADFPHLKHLDLSLNNLSGMIPSQIGKYQTLSYLDLSLNSLSGAIPSQTNLSKLRYLDLSMNYLSGSIPLELQNFPYEAFMGNHQLCGQPTPNECATDDTSYYIGLYVSMGLGFYLGFWGVCGTLVFKHTWRYAFFNFIDTVYNRIYVAIAIYIAKFQS